MAYSTIPKGSLYINTKLYTGDSGTSNSITGVGFQPDMVWIKIRTGSGNHFLWDAVRGANKTIVPNDTDAEATSDYLGSFDSDGFTLTSASNNTNSSSYNYVGWTWKAGNSQGSSNTDGSINTTYTSVNTTSGFSISTYTGNGTNGATIGHGLGVVPQTVWIKRLSNVDGMIVYHKGYGNNASVKMDRDSASTGNFWNSVSPTNQVVTVTNSTENNTSGQTYVMYAFAEKVGYSKFGKYVGNGNADGTFVYTGFKPQFIMWKNITEAYGWYILDVKRDPDNVAGQYIYANLPDAEATNPFFDINSNGFKCRETGGGSNKSGNTFIYFAFGQSLVGSNNVPCTAR